MIPSPGNTIDFDSARLKLGRVAQPGTANTVDPVRGKTLPALQESLNLQLQTSLELDRILEMFFQALRDHIGLDCLEYRHEAQRIHQRIGQLSLHRCSYRITHAGDFLGEIQFSRKRRFSEAQLLEVETLLASLLYPLRNALMYREAVYSALNDSLTGIGNRMALEQAIDREVKLAIRHRTPLSTIVLDIDLFKQINDQYGHAYGDAALRAVVNCTLCCLRDVDGLFRMGGEEFVVLLGNTPASAARLVAERIRSSIEQMQFEIDGISIPMTASLGAATRDQDEDAKHLLDRCDKLMYAAKRAGRNRVCC